MAKTNLNHRNFLRVSALTGGGYMLGIYPKTAALGTRRLPGGPCISSSSLQCNFRCP